ncbi:MAG: UDP-N-acetylmuramoyl-L-alanine--D-glutamate ligase [Phycisphaerae bacterium]|nr:UDP-N-acetylmuramoyl-L-alanine--D-glutamate ligase [Phycisphaerae bacterium]
MNAAVTGLPAVARDPAGRRVTVVGLGRFGGGVGAVRWLCSHGAHVTVSDRAAREALGPSLDQIADLDVTLHLGGHDEADFLNADLLVVNPAIRPEMPLLAAARSAGVPQTTEMNLFLARCPATVVGVTGTVGKSTTTAMIGAVLSPGRTTHVGGNIGHSLLCESDRMSAGDVAVVELSSFQLERVEQIGVGPHVAVVTNFAPNHLDRHETLAAYAEAKKAIYRYQASEDVLVLNAACDATRAWADEAPGRVAWFDPAGEAFELSVPGAHNQANAQAAWTAVQQLGVSREQAAAALRSFVGLPHRLEFVAERDGVRYYNDSKCTTPDGTRVALAAFAPRRAVVLVGGYDKGVSFDALGEALVARAKAVVALGATREAIIAAVGAHAGGDRPGVVSADTFDEAVAAAKRLAGPGEVVLLSPACASYDMFTNYEERGDRFRSLVRGG